MADDAAHVNAYYDPQMNNVNFPAGYFQPPFYSDKEDDAANYGDMGSTIGHELTHGFDDEGRQYDKDGNLKDWWTKQDEPSSTIAPIAWSSNTMPSRLCRRSLEWQADAGENLADLGGLWLAWLAWEDKAQTAHLDLTAKNRWLYRGPAVWIAYEQQWCTQTRPEQLRSQAQGDPHAPDEYRANTSCPICRSFKKLQLQEGRAMVAPKPCRVW